MRPLGRRIYVGGQSFSHYTTLWGIKHEINQFLFNKILQIFLFCFLFHLIHVLQVYDKQMQMPAFTEGSCLMQISLLRISLLRISLLQISLLRFFKKNP